MGWTGQRERASEPIDPVKAPATAARTRAAGRGARVDRQAMSAASAPAEMTSAGRMTAAWPRASTCRARSGEPIAWATTRAALTAPAAE